MKTKNIAWLAAIALLALVIGYFGLDDHREHELAASLQERIDRQQASVSPSSGDAPAGASATAGSATIHRLSDKVLVDSALYRDKWAVHRLGQIQPRIVLPFDPSKIGTADITADSSASAIVSIDDHGVVQKNRPQRDLGYVGADACMECHQQKHHDFVRTAHHRTTAIATRQSILGPLDPPRNEMTDSTQVINCQMEWVDGKPQQVVAIADYQLSIPMDVIAGSGKIAQSFLHWNGDELYQSHATYFSRTAQWHSSPGFNPDEMQFVRVIRPECLECHATFADLKRTPNHYHRETMMWGISCERCHGPGQQHVTYHRDHPGQTDAKHIVDPRKLTRQQQLDVCGQCHGGSFDLIQAAFTYRPGLPLDEYHHAIVSPDDSDAEDQDSDAPDVHTGDQLKRMTQSVCFQQSQMTCTSCHNPHLQQRGDLAGFSSACIKCHLADHCAMNETVGPSIIENCIDCHMPTTQHSDLASLIQDGLTIQSADHFIRINHDASDRYLRRRRSVTSQ